MKERFKKRFKKKHLNLFAKYFLVITMVIFICFAVLGCSLLLFVSNYWRSEKTSLLKENALQVASTTADLLGAGQLDRDGKGTVAILCNTLTLVSSAIEADVFICNLDGSVILCKDLFTPEMQEVNASSCQIHDGMHFPKEVVQKTIQKEYIRAGTLEGVYSDSHFIIGEPVIVNGEPVALVFATKPTSSGLGPYLWNIFKMFLFSALMALLLAFVAVYVLTYNLIRPLREMSAATKRYARGDFSYRVDSQGSGEELAELAGALNSMAKALAVLESSRRSFVANVSHELKTPMTTIGGFIDGMLDGTIPPENQNHYLGIVSQEVGRLTRLIKNMLDITKLEAGEYKVNATTYDIWESITSVVFGAEQRLEANNIQISGFAPTKTLVLADQDLVYQVIYNLVDNAIKFCNVGGEIRFSVTQSKGAVTVGVRNTGAGIAPEALPYVFDRFYKEDKSRGLNTTGSGLGLHICKVLINLSGGKIWVDSKEGEYCEFLFTLPAPPSSPIKGGKLKDQ